MKRFLVTGGCGFIGSHLVDALQAAGHRVSVLDNLSTGRIENVRDGTPVIVADVADAEAVQTAMRQVDGCFHLAAVASVAQSNADWPGTHRTNLTGTINVFDAARARHDRAPIPVVYASSAAVYGDNTHAPLVETDEVRPLTAYGADKLGCELHARVAYLVHRVPTVGFRLFNVYGPRQEPFSPYSGVISIFAARLSRRLPIQIFGDGSQTRDFVYVGDVVRFLLAGITGVVAPTSVFNVCTGRATRISTLALIMGALSGVEPEIEFRPRRPGDIHASTGDPRKAATDLGVSATTDLRQGLASILHPPGH